MPVVEQQEQAITIKVEEWQEQAIAIKVEDLQEQLAMEMVVDLNSVEYLLLDLVTAEVEAIIKLEELMQVVVKEQVTTIMVKVLAATAVEDQMGVD